MSALRITTLMESESERSDMRFTLAVKPSGVMTVVSNVALVLRVPIPTFRPRDSRATPSPTKARVSDVRLTRSSESTS